MKRALIFSSALCLAAFLIMSMGCTYTPAKKPFKPAKVKHPTLYNDNCVRLVQDKWFQPEEFWESIDERINYFREKEKVLGTSNILGRRAAENIKKFYEAEYAMLGEIHRGEAAFLCIWVYFDADTEIDFIGPGALILDVRMRDESIVQTADNGILFFPAERHSDFLDSSQENVRFNQEYFGGTLKVGEPHTIFVRLKQELMGLDILNITIDEQNVRFLVVNDLSQDD
jgi:hypothetical protein